MDDGTATRPFGDYPVGYVTYTEDGHMITTISEAGRSSVGGDLLSVPDAARAEAFASFVAYAGTFRVEGDEVIHHVEMSLYPDWVGSEQRREIALSPDRRLLTLSSGATSGTGASSRHRLHWVRVIDVPASPMATG